MQKHLKDDVPKPFVLRKCAEVMEREGLQVDGSLYIGRYMREPIPFAKCGRLEGINQEISIIMNVDEHGDHKNSLLE